VDPDFRPKCQASFLTENCRNAESLTGKGRVAMVELQLIWSPNEQGYAISKHRTWCRRVDKGEKLSSIDGSGYLA